MSTVITTDFFRRFKPDLSDRRCLNIARWFTLLLGVVGTGSAVLLAWLKNASLGDRYVKIAGLFCGGLAGLFVAGIFTRRTNWIGALVGFATSAVVLVPGPASRRRSLLPVRADRHWLLLRAGMVGQLTRAGRRQESGGTDDLHD